MFFQHNHGTTYTIDDSFFGSFFCIWYLKKVYTWIWDLGVIYGGMGFYKKPPLAVFNFTYTDIKKPPMAGFEHLKILIKTAIGGFWLGVFKF